MTNYTIHDKMESKSGNPLFVNFFIFRRRHCYIVRRQPSADWTGRLTRDWKKKIRLTGNNFRTFWCTIIPPELMLIKKVNFTLEALFEAEQYHDLCTMMMIPIDHVACYFCSTRSLHHHGFIHSWHCMHLINLYHGTPYICIVFTVFSGSEDFKCSSRVSGVTWCICNKIGL